VKRTAWRTKSASELFKRNLSVSSLVSYGASDVIANNSAIIFHRAKMSQEWKKKNQEILNAVDKNPEHEICFIIIVIF